MLDVVVGNKQDGRGRSPREFPVIPCIREFFKKTPSRVRCENEYAGEEHASKPAKNRGTTGVKTGEITAVGTGRATGRKQATNRMATRVAMTMSGNKETPVIRQMSGNRKTTGQGINRAGNRANNRGHNRAGNRGRQQVKTRGADRVDFRSPAGIPAAGASFVTFECNPRDRHLRNGAAALAFRQSNFHRTGKRHDIS